MEERVPTYQSEWTGQCPPGGKVTDEYGCSYYSYRDLEDGIRANMRNINVHKGGNNMAAIVLCSKKSGGGGGE